MPQGVDGAGRRGRLVGRGVGNHIGSHSEVNFSAGEDLPQAAEVSRIGQIHRNVMGEKVHVELVRHGHADDLAAHQGGLGLFRPGEFIHGQIDLHPQIPDLLYDALVAQGEGIEGTGEERHLVGRFKLEGAGLDTVGDDETVDVGEGGGGIEEGQFPLRLLADEEEDLFGGEGKEIRLILEGEDGGGEQPLTQDPQGLLPHGLPEGGKALEQQPRHPAPAFFQHRGTFPEPLAVDSVVFQHGTHGGQCGVHHPAVGGGEEREHLVQHLVQLPGSQPQGELSQVQRDVLGDLRLAGLQRLGELHGDLVAVIRGEHGGQGQQGRACHTPYHHVFTDLHEV